MRRGVKRVVEAEERQRVEKYMLTMTNLREGRREEGENGSKR